MLENGPTPRRTVEMPLFLRLFAAWTITSAAGVGLALVFLYFGLWGFLEALHPIVLGVIAVALTVWTLYALSPKFTVELMWLVDITLPRGDSALPFIGIVVRLLVVLLCPTAFYLSLMALRQETSWAAAGAVILGYSLGLLGWRSIVLWNIMRVHYGEDEVRKGVLDTGVYGDEAI